MAEQGEKIKTIEEREQQLEAQGDTGHEEGRNQPLSLEALEGYLTSQKQSEMGGVRVPNSSNAPPFAHSTTPPSTTSTNTPIVISSPINNTSHSHTTQMPPQPTPVGVDLLFWQTMLQQNQQVLAAMTKLIELMTVNKRPKPLPLGKFRNDSGETLVQFLDRYERYCQDMYPESTEGLLPLLGTYLEGETLGVYQTIVKNTYDYEEAKMQLLTWFREEKAKEHKNETKNFTEAQIQPNEPITVYALRLEGLARRAFPGCDILEMPILRQKFLSSIPKHIRTQVEFTLSTVETTMGMKVPWDRLVAIVDDCLVRSGDKTRVAGTVVPPVIDLTEEVPFNRTAAQAEPPMYCCHMARGGSPVYQASALFCDPTQITSVGQPQYNNQHEYEQQGSLTRNNLSQPQGNQQITRPSPLSQSRVFTRQKPSTAQSPNRNANTATLPRNHSPSRPFRDSNGSN